MRNLISILILIFSLCCLCGCSANDSSMVTTHPSDVSTQATSEPTVDTTTSTEPANQTFDTKFVSLTDIIPLYDTDSSETFTIPSTQQNEDLYDAAYYHINGSIRFIRSNLLMICTDVVEYNQGSHYAVYEIVDDEFLPLENQKFSRSYDLFNMTYHIEFEYAVYEDQIILTYTPVREDLTDIWFVKQLNKDSYLLEIAEQTADGNVYYHLMILNLETQELTDFFANLDPELKAELTKKQGNDIAFIDENQFVISQYNDAFYYVDLANNTVCELDKLLDTDIEHSFIVNDCIVCYNSNGDFWKINTSDLSIKPLLSGLKNFKAGVLDERYDTQFIIYMTEQEYHVYDTETEQDHILTPPINWEIQLSSLQTSQDGKMTFICKLVDEQYQVLLFNFDTMTFTELCRENENEIHDVGIYWTEDSKIVISSNFRNDWYIYSFK